MGFALYIHSPHPPFVRSLTARAVPPAAARWAPTPASSAWRRSTSAWRWRSTCPSSSSSRRSTCARRACGSRRCTCCSACCARPAAARSRCWCRAPTTSSSPPPTSRRRGGARGGRGGVGASCLSLFQPSMPKNNRKIQNILVKFKMSCPHRGILYLINLFILQVFLQCSVEIAIFLDCIEPFFSLAVFFILPFFLQCSVEIENIENGVILAKLMLCNFIVLARIGLFCYLRFYILQVFLLLN